VGLIPLGLIPHCSPQTDGKYKIADIMLGVYERLYNLAMPVSVWLELTRDALTSRAVQLVTLAARGNDSSRISRSQGGSADQHVPVAFRTTGCPYSIHRSLPITRSLPRETAEAYGSFDVALTTRKPWCLRAAANSAAVICGTAIGSL